MTTPSEPGPGSRRRAGLGLPSDPEGPRGWARDVLDFWFSHGPAPGAPPDSADWWKRSEAFDDEIGKRFGIEWARQSRRQAEDFLADPETALAAIILFDQFPRNMFREHADQFSTDHMALAIAKGAVERGYDDGMTRDQRTFLYMPFQHSEELKDQVQSLLLFTALGDPEQLGYARKHHEVIEKFGRFPHRNALLGRKPTAMELAAGEVVPW
jgi:uncharacterized protein (DUF924 family)